LGVIVGSTRQGRQAKKDIPRITPKRLLGSFWVGFEACTQATPRGILGKALLKHPTRHALVGLLIGGGKTCSEMLQLT
jgi:hypothetical protein